MATKTERYREFEDKYTPVFFEMIKENGIDVENLTDEGFKELQNGLNSYVVSQMRRETNEPTKSEFEQSSPVEQARIHSQKTGMPFDESFARVAGTPRAVASDLYSGSNTERASDWGSDILSGLGRTIKGGYSALTGGNPLEAMGETQKNTSSMLGGILADPMLPVGVGLGKAIGMGGNVIKEGLTRGLAGGTAQSAIESGEQGRLIPASQMMGNLALNIAGETGGGMLGRGGSRVMKETGGATGYSGKGAKEALEYVKLKPQNPIGPSGLRAPYKSNQGELARAVGTEAEIGEELADKFLNFGDYITEGPTIRPMLKQLPETEILPVLEAIEGVKMKGKFLTPEALNINSQIDERVSTILEQVDGAGMVSAEDLFDLRKMLDESVNFGAVDGTQGMNKAVAKGYEKARNYIKNELESLADKSGNPQYAKNMRSMHEKYNVRDKVARILSKNKDVAEAKAEGAVSRLHGKNKAKDIETIKAFDEITGSDIADRSYKAKLGSQIGMEETGLPLFSDVATGKSVLGFTPIGSPLTQANVIYPMADALKTTLENTGLGARVGDRLMGRQREAIEGYFGGLGQGDYNKRSGL
jgi:hypothetical protein